jgi:hypothetical protein
MSTFSRAAVAMSSSRGRGARRAIAGSALPATSRPPSTPPPTSRAPAASGGTGGGPGVRRTAPLRITLDGSQVQGRACSAYFPFNFTSAPGNASGKYGYPGVSFAAALTGAGRQICAAAQRQARSATMSVRPAPCQTALAWPKGTVVAGCPAASCQPGTPHWLRSYQPAETVAGHAGHEFSAYSSTSTAQLTSLPVRAGRGIAAVAP